MIELSTRKDQTVAVMGLGGSGLAAARALAAGGADVCAWDDNPGQRRKAEDSGIPTKDPSTLDFGRLDALVLAPGIPLTHNPHPVVAKAQAASLPVIGDIELLVEACPRARFVGITGTNGKSTTTALLGHLLESCGVSTQIGGNLGPPALGMRPPEDGEPVVLELSSYQLDLTESACFEVAVLLNISPDHLDRHGDMNGYIAAKKRIFRRDGALPRQTAIVGVDDPHSRAICEEISARDGWDVIPVSAQHRPKNGIYVENGILIDNRENAAASVRDLHGIPTLAGIHNWQNAAAAYAAACALGVDSDALAAAFETYPGLPHRMEHVGDIDGIAYVNDSKATNGEAAARALTCFDGIFWIAGGRAKEDGLAPAMEVLGGVRAAFLIGECQDAFFDELDGRVPAEKCGDLATAVARATDRARETGDDAVVLLSPAAASFDQWNNFEARGDGFRALVRAMQAGTAS